MFFFIYSCKLQLVLLACSDSEWMFLIFSYLPPFKLRLTKSHCNFYHFFTCYFLVCKSLPWSNFSSKFRLDCSSLDMVIDLVICRHLKFTFPNFCRKDMMDIIEYNRSRKKRRRPRHFTSLSKVGGQKVLQRDWLGDCLVLASIWAENIVIVFGVRVHNLSIIISLQQLFTDGTS